MPTPGVIVCGRAELVCGQSARPRARYVSGEDQRRLCDARHAATPRRHRSAHRPMNRPGRAPGSMGQQSPRKATRECWASQRLFCMVPLVRCLKHGRHVRRW